MAAKDQFESFRSDGLMEGLGLKALFTFFSAKAMRGSPRLLPQILICAVVMFTLARLLPSRLSDVTLGSSYTKILQWRPKGSHSRPSGEGLRIVVFGGGDVATPNKSPGRQDDKSWTEILCDEVEDCYTHLSYMPRTDVQGGSMVSNTLYESILNQTVTEANTTGHPGYNYSWLPEHYPVPYKLPDLVQQIDAFLSTPPSKQLSRETLWVFNYGYWDIWKLASMPRKLALEAIEVQINHIFEQIEVLYEKSRSESSIAYSDYYNWLKNTTSPPTGNSTAMAFNAPAESFRVFIPTLFDISLTPGFDTARVSPPYPHSRAEEMRNAAYLTDQWEQMITTMMQIWISTPLPLVNGSTNETISGYETRDGRGNAFLAPFPRREVITHDVPKYLRELIVDRQLRNFELQDKNGLGTKPEAEGFQDVWEPCMPFVDTQNTTTTTTAHKRQEDDADYDDDVAEDGTCDAPEDHLFWTEFTVGQRAIDEIGQAAARRFKTHVVKGGQWLKKSDLTARGVEEASWRAVDYAG